MRVGPQRSCILPAAATGEERVSLPVRAEVAAEEEDCVGEENKETAAR